MIAVALAALSSVVSPAVADFSPVAAPQTPACITMNTERLPLAQRQSPLDSVSFRVGGGPVKICYSRPSARGRPVFGGLVPYGQIWRTGANEPTMIHTTVPLTIAGIHVTPGSYSLYTVPNPGQWEIVVNRSITQWGHESNYGPAVRAAEVGRVPASAERIDQPVEQFTIRTMEANANAVVVILEWERTQVMIPITKG